MIPGCHLTGTHSLKRRAMKASTISKGLTLAGGYFSSWMLKYGYRQAPCLSYHHQERVHEAGPSTWFKTQPYLQNYREGKAGENPILLHPQTHVPVLLHLSTLLWGTPQLLLELAKGQEISLSKEANQFICLKIKGFVTAIRAPTSARTVCKEKNFSPVS